MGKSCRLKSQSTAPLVQGEPRPRGCKSPPPAPRCLCSRQALEVPARASQVTSGENPPPNAGGKRDGFDP